MAAIGDVEDQVDSESEIHPDNDDLDSEVEEVEAPLLVPPGWAHGPFWLEGVERGSTSKTGTKGKQSAGDQHNDRFVQESTLAEVIGLAHLWVEQGEENDGHWQEGEEEKVGAAATFHVKVDMGSVDICGKEGLSESDDEHDDEWDDDEEDGEEDLGQLLVPADVGVQTSKDTLSEEEVEDKQD